jgi:glycosyltransferase involved in cell wall biosynthesis
MSRLGADPELRTMLGEKARDHARRHYSIDRMLDRYEALYEELLS